MHIEEHQWWSKHLNRDMALKVYGHWGKPVIVFPCSRGRYFDYEGMGMIEAIAGFINAGKIKSMKSPGTIMLSPHRIAMRGMKPTTVISWMR